MKAVWDSVVRTVVPLIVGFALSLWASAGVTPDPEFATALTGGLTVVFGGLYHVAVRLLETYVAPKFGWLLGLAKQPDYFKRVKVTEDGQTFTVREN